MIVVGASGLKSEQPDGVVLAGAPFGTNDTSCVARSAEQQSEWWRGAEVKDMCKGRKKKREESTTCLESRKSS